MAKPARMPDLPEVWRQRSVELPREFKRYWKIGGVLHFAAYSDADGDEETIAPAIGTLLRDPDLGKLRELGSRPIKQPKFFGDWYDLTSGDLMQLGTWRTEDERDLVDPRLKQLQGVRVSSGGAPIPEAGSGGQFAYAFTRPPYGLHARPAEVQSLFNAIRDFLLPPEARHDIRDWASPGLVEVSPDFQAGMEWWGVFLFSIYTPSTRRLVVIAGSATD